MYVILVILGAINKESTQVMGGESVKSVLSLKSSNFPIQLAYEEEGGLILAIF